MTVEALAFLRRDRQSAVAYRWDRPEIRTPVTLVDRGEELGRGWEGVVRRVNVLSGPRAERASVLAYKEFTRKLIPYREIFTRYMLIKNAGLPVPPTYRAVEDERGILMTDLSAGGENIVLSTRDIKKEKVLELYQTRSAQMNALAGAADIFGSPYAEIRNTYMQKAADTGLLLPKDTWTAIIKPDGMVDFIITDCTGVQQTDLSQPERFARPLIDINTSYMAMLQERIRVLQLYRDDPTAAMELLSRTDGW